MFEEGRLYAPVTTADDGSVTVHLDDDHPGVADPDYRRRRNQIASAALAFEDAPAGSPLPRIDYTDDEQGVWRTVRAELAAKHEQLACEDYRTAMERLQLPVDHIPQLDEVSAQLHAADRLSLRAGGGAGLLRGLLRLAGRRRLSLDPVRSPPRAAAVHARARPDPRGRRPWRDARVAAAGRAQPARGRGRPAARDPGRTRLLLQRVLVLDRVRRRLRARAAARLRRRAALLLWRDRGVPRSGDPTSSTSPRWGPTTTTSPSTSQRCTRPSRSSSYSTSSAASSRTATTTRPRALASSALAAEAAPHAGGAALRAAPRVSGRVCQVEAEVTRCR